MKRWQNLSILVFIGLVILLLCFGSILTHKECSADYAFSKDSAELKELKEINENLEKVILELKEIKRELKK